MPARTTLSASLQRLALVLLVAQSAACSVEQQVRVREPGSVLPTPRAGGTPAEGAIYSDAGFRPFFEDRRARHVGDTLIVLINEKLSATQKSSTAASRTGSMGTEFPLIRRPLSAPQASFAAQAGSATTFEGKGDTSSDNTFMATITAMVIEVLANGNLIVSGEKRIGINGNSEIVKFSGIVNPAHITGANTIASTEVADARMVYTGRGTLDEVQTMGWLQRLFNVISPF